MPKVCCEKPWEVKKLYQKIHDAIDSIHAEEALKRSTKAFLKSKIAPKPFHMKRIATVFASLALVLLGLGSWNFYMTPVSAISVDVNPSIELGVNRFDRVVSVTGYNDDGAALAASVELKNLSYSDALDTLMSSDEMQPYRENDGLVSITVIGNTEQKSEEMQRQIAACDFAASPNVEYRRGNREDVKAAHDAGLSFGKYTAFQELQALDPTISTEDIRGLTMRQIRDRIEELSDGSAAFQNGNGSGRHGSGDGQGSNGKQNHGGNQ